MLCVELELELELDELELEEDEDGDLRFLFLFTALTGSLERFGSALGAVPSLDAAELAFFLEFTEEW